MCQTFLPVPSSGLNLRLLPRPFREQRFPKGTLFPDKHELLRFEKVFGGFGAGTKLKESLNFCLLGAKRKDGECICAYPDRGRMWIEAIFQEIIDRNQSRSFTDVSILPFLSIFPSHRGETHRNRLKFHRDTKKGTHKSSGQFISIYFSLFSRISGPYFIPL